MSLREYERKRDFGRTPEPGAGKGSGDGDLPRFVVQEHHATRLHWDLRLEHEGALASWAVPNGIPEDPEDNRKAVHTEDHPLEYLTFHGEIPEGNYGAGKMTIWDSGTYELHKWEPRKIVLTFHGGRLSGRYALFQAGKSEKDWLIHRIDAAADPAREPMPEHLVPMMARLGDLPTGDSGWAYEIKWDGVRAVAYSEPGRLRLESRNLNDITAQYPEVRPLNRALSSHSAVLDGELVAFDAEGRPSFERLQQRMHLTGESQIRRRAQDTPVVYVLFDLLYLDGRSLMDLPYSERRARLEELGLEGAAWQTPQNSVGGGADLLAATAARGLEGIVAKRLDCPYEPGKRANHWIKVKTKQRQELVIGGWLPGEGRRSGDIGALLMGYWEDGEFRFAGKVGTGFGQRELDMLARTLAPLARDSSPFVGKQPQRHARFVEPRLVAEIEFGEWTKERMLRHPSYKGLRDDKPADQVVRETAQEPPPPEPARKVRRTNVDKVLFPLTGFTKGKLIAYYERMGEVVLPHLHGRPASVKRYPSGVEGKKWWERDHRIDDLPTLLEFANKAAIELHPHLALAQSPDRPTVLVFDLDPGAPAGLPECAEVALALRGMLSQLGLESFVKTSGGKGLQVYVPLNTDVTYDETKPFAKAVAETMASGMPDLVVSRMTKSLREGKVLVDWGQNNSTKSMICAYSLRGKERPTVSMPLAWDELAEPNALRFEWSDALERVERDGDLFAPVLTLKQRLPG
ncbi:MAG TPA: non-homologous end-joining DNA ligase [Thermoleophilaceae bacterium]|nr:non-homologous end-joining DNA ligase [Thermoleophilaceae bacterium]